MKPDPTSRTHPRDPMHGVTLKMVVTRLVERYGWEELARRIRINCFASDPSVASCLKFLRRTPWAREKVERLYLESEWPDDAAPPTDNPPGGDNEEAEK